MEKALKGEKYNRSITIDKKGVATCKHVTKTSLGDFYLTTKIDLSSWSDEEIKRHAAMNILITKVRKKIQSLTSEKAIASTEEVTYTKEMVATERTKKSAVDKASDQLKKMSKEEFIVFSMREYGITRENAEAIADKKGLK